MSVDRRTFIGGAAVAAGLIAAAGAEAKSRSNGGKGEAKALKAIAAYADEVRAAWGIPGITVTVVTDDGFVGHVGSGHGNIDRKTAVTPEQLFQVGSISKMFTALAAWSLIEEGKLSPDARLLDALSGVKIRGGETITLQHLLNHTSGLPADSMIFPDGGLWTGFAPGSNWSYSNAGYEFAGMMAEAASGMRNPELVKERVFDKLGMMTARAELRVADRPLYATGYEPMLTDRLNPHPSTMTPTPWVDSDSPAGSVAATHSDMAIFLNFMIGLARGKGGGVISDETATRFLADPAEGWGPNSHYGNGVARIELDGRKYLHHTGGMVSFCSALHVDGEAGVAAFASANIHYSLNYRPNRVSTYACELFRTLKEGAPAPKPKPATIAIDNPQRFAGIFTAADGDRFETAVEKGGLFLLRGKRRSALQQASGALFATTEPDFAVTGVVIDASEDGKAVRAWVGEKEYAADPAAGYRPAAPADLRALAGRYDDDDRWGGPLYVYARDGALWIGNVERLTRLSDGEWRLGDETSPERVRFDGFINGRPHRLLFSGTPFIRRFS